MEATEKDEGIEVVGPDYGLEPSSEPESTEPVATGTEPAPVVGTEIEGTEPEATGTEIEPTGTEATGEEPAGKTDEVPKMLGDMVDQVKKLHDRFGYLQRQVETIRQAPTKPVKPEKTETPRPKEEDFETYDNT